MNGEDDEAVTDHPVRDDVVGSLDGPDVPALSSDEGEHCGERPRGKPFDSIDDQVRLRWCSPVDGIKPAKGSL